MKLLLILLAALPAAAQADDLSVQILGPERVPLGRRVQYTIPYRAAPGAVLEIEVPGTIELISPQCTATAPVRCTFIEQSPRSGTAEITVRIEAAGTYTATARITGAAPDPHPPNNTARLTTEVVAAPSLVLDLGGASGWMSPRQPFRHATVVINESAVPATDIVVTVTLPAGGSIRGFSVKDRTDVTCQIAAGALTCTIPHLTADRVTLFGDYTAPDRADGTPMQIRATVRADEPDFNPADNDRSLFIQMKREMLVTNMNDSGDGSLRKAIEDANRCRARTPCNITFHIPGPVPPGGRFVIQPLAPLPELIGEVTVDGRTQTLLTGDTNPDGPEIEIDGVLLREGAGLHISPNCAGEVYDLSVTNFPGHGIEVSRMPRDPAPEACDVNGPTIRVTVARNHLTGNLRGIAVRSFFTTVEDNVIRSNRRSGIFVSEGSHAFIRGNRVESNGASGIFVNVENAEIERNVIAGNRHWAVARTAGGDVLVSANSMSANVLQGIDIGLDFDTPDNRPMLFWAIYDPARQATIVRGRFDRVNAPPFARYFVELFASSGLSRADLPQAERPLLEHEVNGRDFEIVVPEDLRGTWITAVSHTLKLSLFAHEWSGAGNTSELSNAVYVAP